MGVVSRRQVWLVGGIYGCGQQEAGMASGWNLWVWLVSVVVRRYIYRYLHNNYYFPPTPLVLSLFWQQHPYFFVHF